MKPISIHSNGLNTDGSSTTATSKSFFKLESLTKTNPLTADIIVFGIISGDFLFYINKIYCVYSLEWFDEAILMRAQNIPSC